MAQLFLIDASAIAYRAYFAFANNPLINSKGEDTSAAFGFANTLFKVLREYQPEYMALVFDAPGPTFRHTLHPEYKATREKMPEPMRAQLPRLDQLAAAMGLALLRLEGYEADDVIGTLAHKGFNAGLEVTILSGDKDFMQLVRPGIRLLNPRRAADEYQVVDAAAVQEKFGVEPTQVVDLLALMGDTSDNVPGVPGVGPKTAARLLGEHGSLAAVLQRAEEIKQPKLRQSLIDGAEQARLAQKLVTIDIESPVELDIDQMAVRGFDTAVLAQLLAELEFNRLSQQLGLEVAEVQRLDSEYTLVKDVEHLERVIGQLGRRFAIDLETTSLDPLRAKIVGIALCAAPGQAYYLPTGHVEGDKLDLDAVLARLRPLLEDPAVVKIGQNLKYDTGVLIEHGIGVRGFAFDTMLADYLLDPTGRPHNLAAMARHHLELETTSIEALVGKGKEQISFAQVEPQQACAYAGEDAEISLRLAEALGPQVEAAGMGALLAEVEMPLVQVLGAMERRGVGLDVEFLAHLADDLEGDLADLSGQIFRLAGEEFNINSTQQLAHILFDKIGLKPGRKTKTGYSTDVNVLEVLAQEHDLPARLLDYRELIKLKSTYVDVLPGLVHPDTGRVHCSFNQAVTATGRLSSSEPNLQNIPIRTPLGRQIRKAFVAADEDHCILSADYSQIELRLLAHFSGDEALFEAFEAGEDIHARTASLVFNLMPQFITPDMRAQAKTVNFGVVYGQTPFGLSRQLGIPLKQARTFIESYFSVYAKVKDYMEAVVEQARQDGYVRTILGRRRYLPDINAANVRRRQFAERTAVNTPIQGSQADLIKVAMIRIHRQLEERGLDGAMILQVHDELVFEVGKKDLAQVEALVRQEMVAAMELRVPIVVESKSGANWFVAH